MKNQLTIRSPILFIAQITDSSWQKRVKSIQTFPFSGRPRGLPRKGYPLFYYREIQPVPIEIIMDNPVAMNIIIIFEYFRLLVV